MCLAGQSQKVTVKDVSLVTFRAEPKPCLDSRPCQRHGTEHGSAHPHHQLHQPVLGWLKLPGLCFRAEAQRRLQQEGAFIPLPSTWLGVFSSPTSGCLAPAGTGLPLLRQA